MGKFVIIYLNNVNVYSKTKTNIRSIQKCYIKFLGKQLFDKPTKCQFCQKSLTFFGQIISGEGIKLNPKK